MPTPSAISRQLYLRLLGFVLPYWKPLGAGLLAMVMVASTEPLFPALMKPLLDGSFVQKDPTLMRMLPLVIVAVFLLRGIASFVSGYAVSWVANRLVQDLRERMFATLVRLPTQYYDNQQSGNLISRFTFDVLQVTGAATSSVNVLVKDNLTILGLLGWLCYLNWKLTLIALAIAPLIAWVVRRFSVRLRSSSRQSQDAMGDLTHVLEESVDCHRVVKVFGGQDYESGRLGDAANNVRRHLMRQASAAAANVPIVQLIAALAVALIVHYATRQAADNQLTVGEFMSFIMAMLMLLAPLKRITGVADTMQRGLAAAETVFALIDQLPEPDQGTIQVGRAHGRVEFRDVCFTYPASKRPALDHVSLIIQPGETVALVGSSGAGKTTLANLIPRFYEPQAGHILLDGTPIAELTLTSLRANVALVSQDVVLFNDSVAANIAYGRLANTPRERIIAAAEAAHAMQFIRDMPEGLDTLIGENGVRLSGGQRQRLAIARALLKDAPVLILDEATSALDSESERQVQAALEVLMRGRTTLVIAHRLSTIEQAHRIVALEHGRIAEIGTHAELLARNGLYARLYRIQYATERGVPA